MIPWIVAVVGIAVAYLAIHAAVHHHEQRNPHCAKCGHERHYHITPAYLGTGEPCRTCTECAAGR